MDNQEKLAISGAQDIKRRQNTITIVVGHHYAHTYINKVNILELKKEAILHILNLLK